MDLTANGLTSYVVNDRVAIITLKGERKGFPLSSAALASLDFRIRFALEDPAVDSIVITGSGDDFCFGADVKQMAKFLLPPSLFAFGWYFRRILAFFGAKHPNEDALRSAVNDGIDVFNRIYNSAKPVVAAVDGRALGGGVELAASADRRIASKRARISFPEIRLGIIPAWLGCIRMVQIACRAAPGAVFLIRTGRAITAEEALTINFFDEVVDHSELLETALRHARSLAADHTRRPRYKIEMVLRHVRVSGWGPLWYRPKADRLLVRFYRNFGGRPLEDAIAGETDMMIRSIRSHTQLLRFVISTIFRG